MPDQVDLGGDLGELVAYLTQTTRLSAAEAGRLVTEVLDFLDESAEEFIRRRHAELQRSGGANADIFAQVGAEAERRRFRAPAYTLRQIRRIIYG